jgi:hypothetical protein
MGWKLRAGVVTLALLAGAAAMPLGRTVVAQDEKQRLACPKCLKASPGAFCPDDGTKCVPAELVALHLALTKHANGLDLGKGFSDPLAECIGKDGTIDVAKLEKLVADYAAAARKTPFGSAQQPAPGPRAPSDPPAAAAPAGGREGYAGRTTGKRNLIARGGGSVATASAVEAALKWLARHQSPDGSWSPTGYAAQCGAVACDGTGVDDFSVGLTGLSLLAFLGDGYRPADDDESYVDAVTGKTVRFGETVKKGLKYLMDHQGTDGALGPQVGEMMYNHAIATQALCDAYGMTGSPAYKAAAQSAVGFIVAAQNYGLAWRYTPKCGNNDSSVTGWCVMALKSAEAAGLAVPATAYAGAKAWFGRVTDSNGQVGYDRLGSGEIYVPGKNEQWAHHQTMTGVALLASLEIDRKKDPILLKGARILVQDLPAWDPTAARPTNDFYYWYYATYALFQVDGPAGPIWKKWNKAVADTLCQNQRVRKDGCKDGSWDTEGVDRWAYAGGRVYGTAMNTLTLEVYYRYPVAAVARPRVPEDDDGR